MLQRISLDPLVVESINLTTESRKNNVSDEQLCTYVNQTYWIYLYLHVDNTTSICFFIFLFVVSRVDLGYVTVNRVSIPVKKNAYVSKNFPKILKMTLLSHFTFYNCISKMYVLCKRVPTVKTKLISHRIVRSYLRTVKATFQYQILAYISLCFRWSSIDQSLWISFTICLPNHACPDAYMGEFLISQLPSFSSFRSFLPLPVLDKWICCGWGSVCP